MYTLKNQFLRFALVGTVSTFTTYSILVIGVEGFHVNAITASAAGYVLGSVVNYLLNYLYTFKSDQYHHILIPKFFIVMVVGMFINVAIMHASMDWLGLHYMVAQLVAIMVVLLWSFTASRLWTFANSQMNK